MAHGGIHLGAGVSARRIALRNVSSCDLMPARELFEAVSHDHVCTGYSAGAVMQITLTVEQIE